MSFRSAFFLPPPSFLSPFTRLGRGGEEEEEEEVGGKMSFRSVLVDVLTVLDQHRERRGRREGEEEEERKKKD